MANDKKSAGGDEESKDRLARFRKEVEALMLNKSFMNSVIMLQLEYFGEFLFRSAIDNSGVSFHESPVGPACITLLQEEVIRQISSPPIIAAEEMLLPFADAFFLPSARDGN